MTAIERLTPTDLINVYVETPAAPARVGALALLDGTPSLDELRTRIAERAPRVPRLRQVVYRPRWFAGRPIWIDAPEVDLAYHVRQIALPGTERLTDLAVRLTNEPLDPGRPLWRVWLVTGLTGGDRAAVVFAMHHVVADGLTTVRLFSALADGARPLPTPTPTPRPGWATLAQDNLARRLAALRAVRLPDVSQWRQMAALRHAQRTSLTAPVGVRRRLDTVTVDLQEAKAAAHRHGGKVNDVVLALAAGGLRGLLRTRGEVVDDVDLHATVAMSLRDTEHTADTANGNRTGGVAVRVPLSADVHDRLADIAWRSAQAKARQLPTASNGLLIGLSRLGLLRWFSRHQRMIHFVESNVAGPPDDVRLLGTTIVEVVPIGTVVGNISIGFLALSYAGRLTIAVQADADGYPDLPILLSAMRRDATALGLTPEPGREALQPAPAGRTSSRRCRSPG
ncbi:MAG: DUF1298 domain-containing protein [Hamadaea sp.]|uniref:wax ester/triacylglycerol synthase domain-containing protein n=1 Tax=Hamadaea sp. TaxID=2024425 RepID=UPI0017B8E064|nr:wax ester/triacylglycerol synthase domain-containing protein [Hamadaea sp.]NUT18883.1 DUF1298 domain-containing protein [Hamadaea sp.]